MFQNLFIKSCQFSIKYLSIYLKNWFIKPKILKYKVYKIFNCGYGKGFSVKEVFDEFNKLSKYKLTPKIQKERSGDLKILVADPKKIKNFLNWKPEFNKLSLILKSSMKWEKIINRKF